MNDLYKNRIPLKQSFATFKELFDSYYASLWKYAYHMVDNEQAAEDIVQDIFMSLWINREKVDFSEPIHSYLFRSVYNRSINYIKSRRFELSLEDAPASVLLHHEILRYNQQDELQLQEITEEITRFIETLPPQCKKVFELSRESHMKNKEIAAFLGISEKTVEGHISKALKDLRQHLIQTGLLSLMLRLVSF